ncbi:lytic transglycosylase domain-containing protein [Leptolyngbya sp. 15MV]|nr:lytic transglycosylase domain-containing protein [Leptolyngbya sp. 15MV]
MKSVLAHRLRTPRFMRKQNHIVAVLLLFGLLICPLAISSQSRSTYTRTSLSKMDVFSRAALFERTIADAARKEGVDPLILWAIAYNETRFRPWLTSPKNAQGLMQFIPATASRFGLADPYEPKASIYAAARYVKYLGGLFNWQLESVLAAYNAGEGTVLAYLHGRTIRSKDKLINSTGRRTPGGVPPYRETINYISHGVKVHRWTATSAASTASPRPICRPPVSST